MTAKPLSVAARKALVESAAAETTSSKVKAGLARIDFREPTAKEREFAEKLAPRARKALARRKAA